MKVDRIFVSLIFSCHLTLYCGLCPVRIFLDSLMIYLHFTKFNRCSKQRFLHSRITSRWYQSKPWTPTIPSCRNQLGIVIQSWCISTCHVIHRNKVNGSSFMELYTFIKNYKGEVIHETQSWKRKYGCRKIAGLKWCIYFLKINIPVYLNIQSEYANYAILQA